MSQWPEPTPDESEPPRWGKWGAGAVVAAAIAVFATSGGEQWRMPALPEFTMPQITIPDFGERPSETPPLVSFATEGSSPEQGAADGSIVQQAVSFEGCAQQIDGLTRSLSQRPTLVEDTADRRVAAFKFLDGDLTVICSRPDGTMTIQRRE